ncbi:MAG: hypothetical protein HY720_32005, partial [Planctomycetes bacterium]|nr:hypothetical protein [Planctomycetota bacterium]
MRILDRYVLWGFVANYLICFCVLVGLYIVLDAFERWETLKEYQEAARRRAEGGAEVRVDERPLPVALAIYYFYNIPVIFVQVAP